MRTFDSIRILQESHEPSYYSFAFIQYIINNEAGSYLDHIMQYNFLCHYIAFLEHVA